MPYVMYLRKSRADLAAEAQGEGETLARHEKQLMDAAKRYGITVDSIYREIVSAETISGRPVMQQLLSEVEQGLWDGVFVVEVERLARGDTIDQGLVAQAFRYSGTQIITPAKIYDPQNEFDEEYFEFGLFMSRREYKTINRRMQNGRLASVKEGKYVGSVPPYGYERVKLEGQKGYTLAPLADQAAVVRLIFHLYTQGMDDGNGPKKRLGARKIAARLNALQVPSKRGGEWLPGAVLDILHNPVYIGKVRWNNRPAVKKVRSGTQKISRPRRETAMLEEGRHPALITENEWTTAQSLLNGNRAVQTGRSRNLKNPLAGLIVCGRCGKAMVRRPYAGKKQDYLVCTTPGCNNIGSNLHLITEKAKYAVANWLAEYDFSEIFTEISQPLPTERNGELHSVLEQTYSRYQRQMDRAYDLLEQDVYTVAVFETRKRRLEQRLCMLEQELKRLQTDKTGQEVQPKQSSPVTGTIGALLRQELSAEALNSLLKEVIFKIVYTKEERGERGSDLSNFRLDFFMKL